MKPQLSRILIFLGIASIISFTLFSIILYVFFNPTATTTTTTTSNTTTTTTTTSTTTPTTTTTSTTTPTTTTTSTTTSTTRPIECGSNIDCGEKHYSGTYFCNKEVISLMECTPKCVHGICKEKCVPKPIDQCGRNETCIPGRRACIKDDEFENVSSFIEIRYGEYAISYKHQFRLNYTVYISEYEISAVLVDVIKPGGKEEQTLIKWERDTIIDDIKIGLYAIKSTSVILWIQKT